MSESRQTHVTLHDIDPQALEQLVQYAYTAEIVVGEGNVQVGAFPPSPRSPQSCSVADLPPGAASLLLSTASCFCGGSWAWQWSGSSAASLPRGGSSKHCAVPSSIPEHLPFSWPRGVSQVSFPAVLCLTNQECSVLSVLLCLKVLTKPALLVTRSGTRVKIVPLSWKLPFPPFFSTVPDPSSCCQPASAQWCAGRLLQVPAQPARPLQLPGHPGLC